MMCNLFSIFDPTMSVVNLIPMSFFFSLIILPLFIWMDSFISYSLGIFSMFVFKEMSYSLGEVKAGMVKFMGSVLLMLCIFNFFSMFPFIFSTTSHLTVTFPLSFSIWLMIMLFFWSNYMSSFLSHLIPVGTPVALISFMVVVELVSNFIRPIALTFRLTANMMAGHLLMSLIGGFLVSLNFSYLVLGSSFQLLLVLMELGVSFIQSYVFFTLLVLYMSEMR